MLTLNRRTLLSRTLATTAFTGGLASPLAWLQAAETAIEGGSAGALSPYSGEDEMRGALTRWRDAAAALAPERLRKGMGMEMPMAMAAAPTSASPASPAPVTQSSLKDAGGPGAADASITNVQTAGVDEGDIVKRCGEHLVILRRGRLFTVRVGGDALQAVAMTNAYAPGTDPRGAWYDELLASDSTVVVIGYNPRRGGTEIGLFDLGPDGAPRYRATYHLRSDDYYASRNYASRLIGRKLIFYTPTLLQPHGPRYDEVMPAVRRWTGADTPSSFQRILPATRVYRTDDEFDPRQPLALHTLTTCDLGGPELRCESTAVLGPAGRVFYVSAGSVYIWTSPLPGRGGADRRLCALFRIPLDGATPTGLKTAGVPIDQMSFLEEGGHLNVLLRAEGRGESMWGGEAPSRPGEREQRLALLRVPLQAFGDGRTAAQATHYRVLPVGDGGRHRPWQNRFIGDWLVYGGGDGAWALRPAGSEPAVPLPVDHPVERIEAMGPKMTVLVGNKGADLHFSSLRLGNARVESAGRHVQAGARQGETRTHGFFYLPQGEEEGLLGLPVVGAASGVPGVTSRGPAPGAAVLYLAQKAGRFSPIGELKSQSDAARVQDACQVSCVDWYGNARPIFLGGRVLALLGYELVEGRIGSHWRGARLTERRRISFAPTGRPQDRYSPFD
jgi:hypothetical protein